MTNYMNSQGDLTSGDPSVMSLQGIEGDISQWISFVKTAKSSHVTSFTMGTLQGISQ